MIRLQAFGGLNLDVGHVGVVVPSVRPRVLALLALLLGPRAGALSRDKVLAYLWPDSDIDHARNSLKQALFTLRQCLGRAIVQPCYGGIRLDRSLVHCDVWEFEEAICAGRLERAAELYRGPFLDGIYVSGLAEFERWVDDERQRMDQQFGLVLQRLACQARAEGRLDDAVEWSRRLALREPLSSAAALRLMRALVAAGDPTAALDHFRRYARRIGAELGSPPADELVRLASEIRRDLAGPAESPPFGSPPVRPDQARLARRTQPAR
jgi:DNA-binding SARP family transcriptional activator